MDQRTVAQRYINLMAKAFQILCSVSDLQLILSKATAEDSDINDYVKSQFDEVRKQDLTVLLNVIQELLSTMIEAPPAQQRSYAAAICLCRFVMPMFLMCGKVADFACIVWCRSKATSIPWSLLL